MTKDRYPLHRRPEKTKNDRPKPVVFMELVAGLEPATC